MVADEFEVNLVSCSIGDQGCKYLIIGLHKYIYIDTHSVVTTLLHMTMDSNAISHHGLHHLSTLLKIGCVNYLSLNYNNLSERDTAHATLGIFAEQLKNNSTLRTLWLSGCGLNTQCAECLAEALTTNNHLKQLCIPNNALCDDGIQHLAHALRVNHGLQNLYLVSCGMTDEGLECLTKSLQQNNALNQLWVWNNSSIQNRLTEKIVPVLTEYLQYNHTLTWLQLPKNLESYTASIEKAVNDVRERRGLLLIKVIGMSVALNKYCIEVHILVLTTLHVKQYTVVVTIQNLKSDIYIGHFIIDITRARVSHGRYWHSSDIKPEGHTLWHEKCLG